MLPFTADEFTTSKTWRTLAKREMQKKYFRKLQKKLEQEYDTTTYWPPRDQVFAAFNLTPWSKVKVVILGQDPYHNPGQAMGLAFSHPREIKLPPRSCLRNIYKELRDDPQVKFSGQPDHGDLTSWAQQGVLLLNTALTVKEKTPAAHADYGWHQFTDRVIELLSHHRENLVFLLWGGHAQGKAKLIDAQKHLVLKTSHPSGLSCHRGFLGSRHFSQCNEYLRQHHQPPIKWNTVLKHK